MDKNQIQALLAQGNKIEAIKLIREQTGRGLKTSKEYVDALAQSPGTGEGRKRGEYGMMKFIYYLLNKLFMLERVFVKEYERGLLFKKGRLLKVLQPGHYHFWNVIGQISYDIFDITTPEFASRYTDALLKHYPEVVSQHFFVADSADNQVAVISIDGKLHTVLPPGVRQLFWKELREVAMELVDISEHYEIPPQQLRPLTERMNPHVLIYQVPEGFTGLLFVDGKFVKTLSTGSYGFWRSGRDIRCETVDIRLQQVDVSGQEMLTKDRVSLRVNLTCWFVITDPVKAKTRVSNYADHLYKEVQFGIREAVSVRSLDELLADKDALNRVILDGVKPKLADIGIEARSLGVKDVILPGDMREIMNKVIEAKKLAEANQIKRREETAATRSLLNTAKLMADNPTLLRLKELETLEKITDKIETLNVYSGFDGVLKELVHITAEKKE